MFEMSFDIIPLDFRAPRPPRRLPPAISIGGLGLGGLSIDHRIVV
jgi:hypothetical protein